MELKTTLLGIAMLFGVLVCAAFISRWLRESSKDDDDMEVSGPVSLEAPDALAL